MSFINWGDESPEQKAARARYEEEQMLFEQVVRFSRTTGAMAGVGSGQSPVSYTFAFKSNSNTQVWYLYQNQTLEGNIIIDWGDGVIDTLFVDQQTFQLSHTYDKQNEDKFKISISADFDILGITLSYNRLTELEIGSLPTSLQLFSIFLNELTKVESKAALPNSLTNLVAYGNQITEFNVILPSSLEYLDLTNNQLTNFDLRVKSPSSLRELKLGYNPLISFDPSHALPSSLEKLELDTCQLVNFDPAIDLPSSLTTLDLRNNNLTDFNPTRALPNSITHLWLINNQLTNFNPSIALPNSITHLLLYSNQLTNFNPSIALPSSLQLLHLDYNPLSSFNPSIALPSSLQELSLNNLTGKLLTSFNPSIALPSSLQYLGLGNNGLTSFNPSIALPSSIRSLYIWFNSLSTEAVNESLILLDNTLTSAPGNQIIWFVYQTPHAPPTGAGLAAKTSLRAKGFDVWTD